jgi:nitrate/TMAO reductase-like tetraheme cytochrome c subunit
MKNLLKVLSLAIIAGMTLASCEGPAGPAGKDANETCKECHNPTVVDLVATQYELSKHMYGEAAFEEAGSNTCGPCHLSESFKDVCARNVPATFTLNATTSKYSNDYFSTTDKAYGEISCFTCLDSSCFNVDVERQQEY